MIRLLLSIFFISLFAFKHIAVLLPTAGYESVICFDNQGLPDNDQEQNESEKETEVKEKFVEEFIPFQSAITFSPFIHSRPTNKLHWLVKEIQLSQPTPPPELG